MISGPPLRLGINLDAMTVYLHKNGEIIESKEQKRGTLSIAVVILVHPAAGGKGGSSTNKFGENVVRRGSCYCVTSRRVYGRVDNLLCFPDIPKAVFSLSH